MSTARPRRAGTVKRPSVERIKTGHGFVGAWGRFAWTLRWQDPPFWRWPRVEFVRRPTARTVLIGWRETGLLLALFDRGAFDG